MSVMKVVQVMFLTSIDFICHMCALSANSYWKEHVSKNSSQIQSVELVYKLFVFVDAKVVLSFSSCQKRKKRATMCDGGIEA